MSKLTVIEQNQQALKKELGALQTYALDRFNGNEKKLNEFRANLSELAYNNYLMSEVAPRHILKMAIDLTTMGLNINPRMNQVSIVPFNVKGVSGKVPSEIIHLKGHQEILYNGGFFLTVDNIWEIDGKEYKESEMSFSQLAQIKDTDKKYREKHFIGFWVEVEDLRGELPKQSRFVSFGYTKEATKNMSTPDEFLIEGLIHKAVRKALKGMVIPQSRVYYIDKMEVQDAEIVESEEPKAEAKQQPKSNPLEAFKEESQDADIEEKLPLEKVEELLQNYAMDTDNEQIKANLIQLLRKGSEDDLREKCEDLGLCK